MAEYLEVVRITAAGYADVGIPTGGAVVGISSTAPVQIGWIFNDEIGALTSSAVSDWEPHIPFMPAATSKIRITATAAAVVSIRMCKDGA